MEPEDLDRPQRPLPPSSAPPQPPSAEETQASAPSPGLHPVLDFFQSQVEALQRQLDAERAKARAAEGALAQQEALRSEVESALKGLTEQLRREKAERESDETKSHARGRIDALETRLDQMHQTWAGLLQGAIARREGAGEDERPSAHAAELAGALAELKARLEGGLGGLQARVEELGGAAARQAREAQAEAAREAASLTNSLDGVGLQVERQLGERFAFLAAELHERLSRIEKAREADASRWDELRAELRHDRAHRERQLGEHGAHLSRALDELHARHEAAAAEAAAVKSELARVLQILTTPAQAKDHVIAEIEGEKQDLIRALKERSRTFEKYIADRRHVEKTLGESLLSLHAQLDAEREKARLAESARAELAFLLKSLEDRLSLALREAEEKDRAHAALAAQRDELAGALVTEAEKVRAQLAARSAAERAWNERDLELRERLSAESKKASEHAVSASELRAQLATLSEHMAKALQEKDAIVNRYAAWDKERTQLLKTIRDKDDMIAMISSTFQNLLKKP